MDLCERICTPTTLQLPEEARRLCASLHELGACAPEGETFFPRWGAWETAPAPRDEGPGGGAGSRACERLMYS